MGGDINHHFTDSFNENCFNESSESNAGDPIYCFCGLKSVVRRSKTSRNPGRLFLGCPNYKIGNYCNFFCWVDGEDNASERSVADRSVTKKSVGEKSVAEKSVTKKNAGEKSVAERNVDTSNEDWRMEMNLKVVRLEGEIRTLKICLVWLIVPVLLVFIFNIMWGMSCIWKKE